MLCHCGFCGFVSSSNDLLPYSSDIRWKLGQLRPGSIINFQRISIQNALFYSEKIKDWINVVLGLASGFSTRPFSPEILLNESPATLNGSKLQSIIGDNGKRPQIVFRQVNMVHVQTFVHLISHRPEIRLS